MHEPYIDLEWWPSDGDGPIGEASAQELVAAPMVEAAPRSLQARATPGTEIARSGAPASYLGRTRFAREMTSLCVGTVYEVGTGDPESCPILPHRDGRFSWRRD